MLETRSETAAKNIARRAGSKAFHDGRAYESNPYRQDRQPELHLAWSEGHNNARVMATLGSEEA